MNSVVSELPTPNTRQKEAIEQLDGPIMLLAGPGSGKTFTLIERIKAMLNKGIKPESILCLTFSEAASSEMKSRLVKAAGIDSTKAMGVKISTYHAFCMDLIQSYPSKFELVDNVEIVDEITKRAVVKEALDELEVEFLKDKYGNKYHFVGDILGAINTIKRERVSKEEYFNYLSENPEWQKKLEEQRLDLKEREEKGKATKTATLNLERQERKIGKAKEVYEIFTLYEKKLKSLNLIDFTDMINLVIETLESDSDFLKEVMGTFKYMLVDEYQDTNSSQNSLIFLAAEGAQTENIFVVGDDDQIIYSFQGARCDNLKNFLHKYPKTKVICLNENNRSTQTILDFAESIIQNDPSRLENDPEFSAYGISKKLDARNANVIKQDRKIRFSFYEERIQENNAIVRKIEEIATDAPQKLSEIAVLCRQHGEVNEFAKLLEAKNIPYQCARAKSVFEIPAFILAYFYLKALEHPHINSDKFFALLTNEPFSIPDKDYVELLIQHRKNGLSFFENARLIENGENRENSEALKNFLKTYEELKKEKSYKGLYNFVLGVINKSGIMDYYKENFDGIAALRRLLKEVSTYLRLHKNAMLGDFLQHLETYLNENIPMEIEQNAIHANAVQLLTYHASKGREFEHVLMPNLSTKTWEESKGMRGLDLPLETPAFSTDPKTAKLIENLKLIFVGITRSKYGLHLSLANATDGKTQSLSMHFQDAINCENLVMLEQVKLSPEEYVREIKTALTSVQCDELKSELAERTKNLTVSATELNAYLSCPQKYYWGYILKIPVFKENVDSMSYGSAIHKTLEYGFRLALEQRAYPEIKKILEIFEEKMCTLEFSSQETREQYRLRGINALQKGYVRFVQNEISHIKALEEKLEYEAENYTLKGFVDMVRKDNDGKYYLIDFKTGSKRPVKEDGDYHNQLKFYKYLFEKRNPKNIVGDCSLVFVEDDFATVSAELVEWDMEDVEKKINSFVENVKALKFDPTPSEDACKYCNYSLICKLGTNSKNLPLL